MNSPTLRFPPPIPDSRPHCLNCTHGDLSLNPEMVFCAHPGRDPKGKAHRTEVIRWAVGCPQHEPKAPKEMNYGSTRNPGQPG